MMALARARAPFALALIVACGGEGPPNPVPIEQPEVPPAATPIDTVRRTVSMRSPLGGPPGNLLIDGDFEMAIIVQGTSPQSGWFAFGQSQRYIRGETGGLCRSGLRCAVLGAGSLLFGRGAAANGTGMVASVYVKLPPARSDCLDVQVDVVNCNFSGFSAPILPVGLDDGWCHYQGRIGPRNTASCMLVEDRFTMGEEGLVDNAVIAPDTGQVPFSTNTAITPFVRMPEARAKRVRTAVEWMRKNRKIGAPLADRVSIGER